MGVLGGVFVLRSGLRILIWAPQVPFSVPPKKAQNGSFLAILLILVIFPLKFPLKPKTANGKKCPTAKTKTVLESVNKMEQLVGMSTANFRNSLK